jgi:hypothetical protein
VAEQKKNSKASAITESSLGDQSLAALMQVRQDLEQKRAAELAAWEQDFRKNTAPKFAATQSSTPAPMAQPGQGHSELRAQLSMLDAVIKKQQQLDALGVQAKKLELLNEPDVVDDLNTSMYVRDAIRNNRYDYAALNKRLDSVIPRVSNRITQRQAAWKKPRAMSEDAGSVEAWGYTYNRRDQRVMWRKTFAGEAAAQAWADQRNATILGMRPVQQGVAEAWSQKYKSSINCSHPKGFSQKAHCAGKRKHNEDMSMEMVCEDCGMCETHGDPMMENLRDWFKDEWVRFGPDGKIRGDCARGSSKEGKPKCLPRAKAHALGKKGRASAAARKRREDPNANRSGPAINVSTKGKKK